VKTAKKKSFGSGISICGSVKTNQAAGKISEPVINVTKRILNCQLVIGHAKIGDLLRRNRAKIKHETQP
jgi:hypothetical protein